MAQLLEFAGNHPALTFALIFIVVTLVWTFVQGGGRGVSKLSPTDATRLINRENAVVLDVRGDGEFEKGHILNAVHVPSSQVEERIEKLAQYRDRPVITACRTGQRSSAVCGTLRKHGFERVYHLQGGMLAWEHADLPVVRK